MEKNTKDMVQLVGYGDPKNNYFITSDDLEHFSQQDLQPRTLESFQTRVDTNDNPVFHEDSITCHVSIPTCDGRSSRFPVVFLGDRARTFLHGDILNQLFQKFETLVMMFNGYFNEQGFFVAAQWYAMDEEAGEILEEGAKPTILVQPADAGAIPTENTNTFSR